MLCFISKKDRPEATGTASRCVQVDDERPF
nr:MAG TPA: hypothetical protein [Caudoviricetes sp.]DAU82142.1 MAG TPA: hypothetical protein [Caudoviricetes sp.]